MDGTPLMKSEVRQAAGAAIQTAAITGASAAAPAAPENDFLMTVRTTGASETFTIPCQNVGTFNATIDWGDGSADSTITTYNDADLAHTYAVAGDYQIRVSGTFPNIYFNNVGDKLKVRSVDNLGSVGWTRLNNSFYGCANMTSFTAGDCDTSAVVLMGSMFFGCSSVTTLDVSGFNTSLVTHMGSMFNGCSSATSLDVSGFNTSLVTNMGSMFQNCSSVTTLDVSGFSTAIVTNMANMFLGCSSVTTLDVSGFNTAIVPSMSGMFRDCSSVTTLDVSGFNTAIVTTVSSMFNGCTALASDPGLVGFDVSSVTVATNMCSGSNAMLSTAEYDAILIAWAAQTVNSGVSVHFGDATYSAGAAATARATLVTAGWTITGDSPA